MCYEKNVLRVYAQQDGGRWKSTPFLKKSITGGFVAELKHDNERDGYSRKKCIEQSPI